MLASAPVPGTAPERLLSLDVFRGLIIAAMILVTDPGTYSARYAPLCHSDWVGPTATDIISPAFLLMIGMAIPLSFASQRKRGISRLQLVLHIARRTALLIFLGLFLNAFPDFHLATLRVPGILQHIAVCYLAASLVYVAATSLWRTTPVSRNLFLAAAAIALLVLYAALLKYVPVPGFGPGHFDSLGSLPASLDRRVFGVRHLWPYGTTPGYGVTFDPDGLLSTLSGVAIMLTGVLTTEWLLTTQAGGRKAAMLTVAGVSLVLAGYLLGPAMPLVKKLWTPSFALYSAGFALLLFVALYVLIDLLKWRSWSRSFRIFGTNAIFAFALSTLITTLGDRLHVTSSLTVHKWTYQHLFATWLSPINASLAYAVAIVMLNLALVYPLFRRRFFLRL